MAESKRGFALTALAVVFALLAFIDFVKPLGSQKMPGSDMAIGAVVFGYRLQGNLAFVGWLIGIFLLAYSYAIFRMKSYALTLAYVYAVYVLLNVVIFNLIYPQPSAPGQRAFGIAYSVFAIAGTWTSVVLLRRRESQPG